MARYFTLGQLPGTLHCRFAILAGDTVTHTQISRPDGEEVERPAVLRWRHAETPDVQIKQYRINETPMAHNGEQPRKPTWRRSGRTVAAQ